MSSIIFFLIFIPILSLILLSVNFILAPHKPYKEKKTPFECGYHSFLWQNRTQFTISFFIFGFLFLIFDLEVLLVYPFSVSSSANQIFGLVVMIVFTLIVTVGFVFELGKKALEIESKQYKTYVKNSYLFANNIGFIHIISLAFERFLQKLTANRFICMLVRSFFFRLAIFIFVEGLAYVLYEQFKHNMVYSANLLYSVVTLLLFSYYLYAIYKNSSVCSIGVVVDKKIINLNFCQLFLYNISQLFMALFLLTFSYVILSYATDAILPASIILFISATFMDCFPDFVFIGEQSPTEMDTSSSGSSGSSSPQSGPSDVAMGEDHRQPEESDEDSSDQPAPAPVLAPIPLNQDEQILDRYAQGTAEVLINGQDHGGLKDQYSSRLGEFKSAADFDAHHDEVITRITDNVDRTKDSIVDQGLSAQQANAEAYVAKNLLTNKYNHVLSIVINAAGNKPSTEPVTWDVTESKHCIGEAHSDSDEEYEG